MTNPLSRLAIRSLSSVPLAAAHPLPDDLANKVATLTLSEKSVQVSVVPLIARFGASIVRTEFQMTTDVVQALFTHFRNQVTHLDLLSCTNFEGVTFGGAPFTALQSLKLRAPKGLDRLEFIKLCNNIPHVMKEVELEVCRISGNAAQALPQTERLVINQSDINDEDLLEIANKMGSTLVELEIISAEGITTFENCHFPKLRLFKAKQIGLTNAGLKALSQAAPNLEILELESIRFFSTIVGTSFTHLVRFQLKGNLSITNADILALSEMSGKTLRVLDISECVYVSDFKGTSFPELQELYANNTKLNNESLKALSKAAPKLQVLSLYGARHMKSFEGVFFAELRELNLKCTDRLSNLELQHISRMCRDTLQVLDISYADGITSFEGTIFHSLRRLVVQNNPNFTEESVISLSRVAQNTLEELFFGATAVQSIQEEFIFPNLRKLDMSTGTMQNSDLQMASQLYGKRLEGLAINNCNLITTFAGSKFPKLLRLQAQNKTSLTDEWFDSLARMCEQPLELLDLGGLSHHYWRENQEFLFVKKINWMSSKM